MTAKHGIHPPRFPYFDYPRDAFSMGVEKGDGCGSQGRPPSPMIRRRVRCVARGAWSNRPTWCMKSYG